MKERLGISIVTPSYNMFSYLVRCHDSIADQAEISIEHIVIDGGSNDGTAEWLRQNSSIRSVIEKDKGMYDAVNKGLHLAEGEILAYLNCDEQYLPGTLAFVLEFFDQHPDIDAVFGNFLVVRPNGDLISFRKAAPARWQYIATSYLYVFTCTMFFRRRIVDDGLRFDTSYKAVADLDFVLRVMKSGYKFKYLNRFLSAFTVTGGNLGVSQGAVLEWRKFVASQSTWIRLAKYPLNWARLIEKFLHGAYLVKKPLEYSIYTDDSGGSRKRMKIMNPKTRWNPLAAADPANLDES